MERLVKIHGYVRDLDERLAEADLAVNLRYPSMGEASAAQLRIWDHALPSLVTERGGIASFREMRSCMSDRITKRRTSSSICANL